MEDLFSEVLDWSLADLNHEIDYADMVITQQGIKTIIIEAKRPGLLAWHGRAIEDALAQSRRYADRQRVPHIVITDGVMLYAADVENGTVRDRAYVQLDLPEPPMDLWWVSVHGIYRPRPESRDVGWHLLPREPERMGHEPAGAAEDRILHSKYKIPATCFAYVGDASRPTTWKLPYRLADGSIDRARLPKAIQAILSNYRGAKVRHRPRNRNPRRSAVLGTGCG